jgi:hypothetical protein
VGRFLPRGEAVKASDQPNSAKIEKKWDWELYLYTWCMWFVFVACLSYSKETSPTIDIKKAYI